MSKEIQIFANDQFGEVRTLTKDGEPWFVGKDVADILGYSDTAQAVRKHIDDEDKGVVEMTTPGGKQNMVIINESGLYSLILSSKLPTARAFKRWVTSEVLPAIRKHGEYTAPKVSQKRLGEVNSAARIIRQTLKEAGMAPQFVAVAMKSLYAPVGVEIPPEGPVIQEANVRALSAGTTTDKIFDMVRRIRQKTDIPMVFMTYANVVYSYGSERFIRTAAEIGMDGLILPDVPFEEKAEFDPLCRQYGLDLVSLIAPTSHDRIRMIAKEASGFVYCVSSLGVTGVRSNITTDIGAMVKLVKETQDIPCAVGFGISTPEQAAKMAAQSDGAIVGSAIVKICAKYGKDCVPHVKEYVKSMKDAVRNAN